MEGEFELPGWIFPGTTDKLIPEYMRTEAKNKMSKLERLGRETTNMLLHGNVNVECDRICFDELEKLKCVNVRLGSLFTALNRIDEHRPELTYQYTVEGYAAVLEAIVIQGYDNKHARCVSKICWVESVHGIARRAIPMGEKCLEHFQKVAKAAV